MTASHTSPRQLFRKHPLAAGSILGLGIISVLALRWVSPAILLTGWIGGVFGGIAVVHPWIGLLLVTLTLPFEHVGSIEILGMTVRASQTLLGLTALGTFFNVFGKRQSFHFKHPASFWLLLFLLSGLASLPQSANLSRGLLVWGFVAFTSLLFWVMPQIIHTPERADLLLRMLLWSAIAVSLFGLVQFLGDLAGLPTSLTGLRPQYTKAILGFPRIQSTMFEPLYFANYLLIPLSLAAAILLSQTRPRARLRMILLFLLGGLSLVLTVSRGGYLAFAVSMLVIGGWYARQLFSPKLWLMGTILACAIVTTAAVFLFSSQATQEFLLHAVNLFGGASYVERVDTFAAAWRGAAEHPIFGIGIGNFGPWIAAHPLLPPETGWAIVNNEYLEVLAETGAVGFLAFMGFLGTLILSSVQAIRRATPFRYEGAIMVGLLAAFLGTLIQYLTFSGLFIMHIWFLIGFMTAMHRMILSSPKIP